MSRFKEHESVRITRIVRVKCYNYGGVEIDLGKIEEGREGVVVDVYDNGSAYEVEFNGWTVAINDEDLA